MRYADLGDGPSDIEEHAASLSYQTECAWQTGTGLGGAMSFVAIGSKKISSRDISSLQREWTAALGTDAGTFADVSPRSGVRGRTFFSSGLTGEERKTLQQQFGITGDVAKDFAALVAERAAQPAPAQGASR